MSNTQVFLAAFGVTAAVLAALAIAMAFVVIRNFEGLKSPSTNRLELDWSVREFLGLFSKRMSQRWYEARAHLKRSVFVSLFCTLGFIDIVCYDFDMGTDGRHVINVKVYFGYRSCASLIKKTKEDIPLVQAKTEGAKYFEQVFIAGYNVAYDIYNDYT